MELVTFESKAYQELVKKINRIAEYVLECNSPSKEEKQVVPVIVKFGITNKNQMIMTNIFHSFFDIIRDVYELFLLSVYRDFTAKYLDNPMLKIVLAFVPAILGIAYPIILQTIGRLND